VKSCANTKTSRPSTRTLPATTPSPESGGLGRHAEVAAVLDDEGVDLVEGARIAKQLHAFAGGELSARVLLLETFLAPPRREAARSSVSRSSFFSMVFTSSASQGDLFLSASIRFAFRNISA